MTNLKQKSVDRRHSRRRRYIDAIEPFRQQFNCTAAQVHGIIQDTISRNESLAKELANLQKVYEDTAKAYKKLEENLQIAEIRIKEQGIQIDMLTADLDKCSKALVREVEKADAAKMARLELEKELEEMTKQRNTIDGEFQ